MFPKRKKSVTILGSCCSRDIFEYLDKASFEINLYIARTKLVSQLSEPLSPVDGINLSSAFQRRLVYNDLEKTQWKDLQKSSGDCCVIDYIDERFKLLKIQTDTLTTYITKSNELISSRFLTGKEYQEFQYEFKNNKWWIETVDLDTYLDQFLENILELYKNKKIVLHKAYLQDAYIKENGSFEKFSPAVINNNHQINFLLNYLYNYTEHYIQKNQRKVYVIDLRSKYLASETHKWGLAAMHYQEDYYREAACLIKKFFSLP